MLLGEKLVIFVGSQQRYFLSEFTYEQLPRVIWTWFKDLQAIFDYLKRRSNYRFDL